MGERVSPAPPTQGGAETILTINCGSSSLKCALFGMGAQREERLFENEIRDHAEPFDRMFATLSAASAPAVTVVGHRVTHGGPNHVKPTFVDDALLKSLATLVPLAPLHLPAAIAGIAAARQRFPSVPHVACFDTAFHATMPEIASRLPLPVRFCEQGIRRYGFHGLSYEHIMAVLGKDAPPRIVIAHLGSGASLVAVKDGRAIDTTMGLTPTGGVMMGTRTGDMDPGALIFAARANGLSTDAIEHVVNHESGLLAVGATSDMATLVARMGEDPRARLAVDMFAYGVKKAIGALVAALSGIDLLVFTGGIGEHAPEVRREACLGLASFGIGIDPERNSRGDAIISADGGPCIVRVIPADEELMIARHARSLVSSTR